MNPGFRDLLAAFNAYGVEFLVVGAHALAAHAKQAVYSFQKTSSSRSGRPNTDCDAGSTPHPEKGLR
jgi:hypothetical protein